VAHGYDLTMEPQKIFETVLPLLVVSSIGAFLASRRERKAEQDISDYIEEELAPQTDWSTFSGDPKLQQGYYLSLCFDLDSSFYEQRQYEEDNYSKQPVTDEWMMCFLPGIDRDLSLALKSDFSKEQYSAYWQRIFVLECGHNLACVHVIDSTTEDTYCFICRSLQIVRKIVKRQDVFPGEGQSIDSREKWSEAREKSMRNG
jgi:hypothetical protein